MDSDQESEDSSDESPQLDRKQGRRLLRMLSPPKLIANVLHTQYSVVKEVLRDMMHFSLSTIPAGEWDLYWADCGISAEHLSHMKPYQKANHFPNMACLARKNLLGRNLMRMRKAFPKDYNFFPQTWLLPMEWNDLRAEITRGKNHTYILKPEALSQGKGIFLTRNFDNVDPGEHYVAQRYIRKPYLIDGLKFDLRIYVLIYGCDPLRLYIYKEGLARLATAKYEAPKRDNMDNLFMHLTNYAINKKSKDFVFNSDADKADVGHKRSLDFVWRYVDAHGGDSRSLRRKIRRCIVKTFCAVQPQLSRVYRSCQPNDVANNMCFEVLGFDILLDQKLKPWLLEVNHAPSFTTDTPFDHKVKAELLSDTMRILHMDPTSRTQYHQQRQAELSMKAVRKSHGRATREEREEARSDAMCARDEYETAHLGGYTRIYPDPRSKIAGKCEDFLAFAGEVQDQFYGISKKPALPAGKGRPSTASVVQPHTRGKSTMPSKPEKKRSKGLMSEKKQVSVTEKAESDGTVMRQMNDIKRIYGGGNVRIKDVGTVVMRVKREPEKENEEESFPGRRTEGLKMASVLREPQMSVREEPWRMPYFCVTIIW